MKAKDETKQKWLKNWANIEAQDLMRQDRDNVRNHIELYSDDLHKLSKVIEKLQDI